jgi:hypothetical protein
MRGRAWPLARRRWAGATVALLLLVPRASFAQTSEGPPAPVAPGAAVAAGDGGAGAADVAALNQAQSAAALHAAQELEVRVVELGRQLEAMERERASFEDLRRRLDELEARQATIRYGAPGDWMSADGGPRADGLRFAQNGLVIRSPGNRFLLRPGLRLQGAYEADLADAGVDDAARPDSSTFRLAHAELIFEGHAVSPRFEFRFELDFADTQAGVVKDAFVQWRFAHSVALRMGQLKVPFGLETQYWNALLELVDVARATSAFTLDRDVGLMVVGRPLGGRLQYHLAATNGPRTPCPRNVDGLRCDAVDLAYAGRIVAAPFGPLPIFEGDVEGQRHPLLAVGVSAAYLLLPTDVRARTNLPDALIDVDHNGRVDNVGVWQGALELRAMMAGVSVQGEWLGRREHPGAGQADRTYWGAYGQASAFVLPHRLQVVARFGRTDLPLYGTLATDRLLHGTRTTEETAGLNAYLRGHDAKLQVDFTRLSTPDASSAPTVERIRAAIQLAF